ncbi:MAG: hypothetical protein GX050_01425 [Firmicutes bacterium]|nr:hypothetical protein [Bacillota bacterium]
MRLSSTMFLPVCLLFCFLFAVPAGAQGEWRSDPVHFKYKIKEEETFSAFGGGWGFYAQHYRWTTDLKWRSRPTTTEPLSFRTELRRRVLADWWLKAGGKYGYAPTCDFRWVEFELEKTQAHPLSVRTWGSGEWRRVFPGARIEDYDRQLIGISLRWRPKPTLRWKGEFMLEDKTYPTPSRSSRKLALRHEFASRFTHHRLTGIYANSTREYPRNPWINYSYRSFRLEWVWAAGDRIDITAKSGLNYRRSGNGKEGGKLDLTGIYEYTYSPGRTVSGLLSASKVIAAYEPLPEDVEEDTKAESFPFSNIRCGLRWREKIHPFLLRTELFVVYKEALFDWGGMLNLQVEVGKVRVRLGLAPKGGFYQTAEKGYWVEVRYYFD